MHNLLKNVEVQMLHAGLLRLLLHEVEAQTSRESVGRFLWVGEHPAGFSQFPIQR